MQLFECERVVDYISLSDERCTNVSTFDQLYAQ